MNLLWRRLRGLLERRLHPGFSSCYRCWRPWACVRGHATMYSEHEGCFPLCQQCWSELPVEGRLPYYKKLWISWDDPDIDWEPIRDAVYAEAADE